MRSKSRFRTRKNLLAGICLVMAMAAAGCGTTTGESASSLGQAKEVALSVCHSAVKNQVNPKPGSLQFGQEKEKETNYGFVVTGQVTARDSEGTSVQNHFTCSAEQNGSTWIAQGVTLSS